MANPIFVNEKPSRAVTEFDFLHDPNDKNSKLGVGSFASVKLAKEKKSGKSHAIKIICMHPSKVTSSDLHNIRTEITIHRKLEHPNIVKFHDYMQKDHNVYLILDYAESGNLYSFMHKRKSLSPDEVFRFFHQTCLAIQYLHQNDILHRDIKPENLLLDKTHNIKLCDFGWATRRITEKRLTFCGTYEYMAPEIVHKKPYDYRVDIWSLGVLLYELLHKEAPYKGRSLPEITKSLAKSQITFSSQTPADAKDLILRILKTNPSDRLSMNQILSHAYVKSHLPKDTENSVQLTDFLVSPRQIKSAALQASTYGESPKMVPRREKENFKSEIFTSGDHGLLGDITTSLPTKRNAQLFSSFNGVSFKDKDTERTRDRARDLTTSIVPESANASQTDLQRRKPLQEFASNLQLKTVNENILTTRGHTKSSSSLTHNMLEKLILDEKKTPSNLSKKKRIFENNMLSPNFRTKVNSIIHQLSSHTTTNKTSHDISNLFAEKMLNQHTTRSIYSGGLTSTSRYHNENPLHSVQSTEALHISRNKTDSRAEEGSHFNTSSSTSNIMRTRAETVENMKRTHTPSTTKNTQVKLNLAKGDDGPTFSSPLSNANRTARSKLDTRSPEPFETRVNLVSYSQKFAHGELEKALLTKGVESSISSFNKSKGKSKERQELGVSFNNFYKSLEYKKKPGTKFMDEIASNHGAVFNERRNERKEHKRELLRDKENHVGIEKGQLRNWAL